MLFRSLLLKSRKRLARDVILLPHMTALFMTSLYRLLRTNWTYPRSCLLDFRLTFIMRNQVKDCCMFIIFILNPISFGRNEIQNK